MFSWLKSWFVKPTPAPSNPPELWHPGEQMIYRYFAGKEGVREVDPMPLYRKVKDIQQEVNADLILARSEFKGGLKGYEQAANRIRKAFDLKPYEEGGITEVHAVELFSHFLGWVGTEKKSTPSTTTASAETSTPTPASSGASANGTSATANGSAGGSTGETAFTGTPTQSPSGSA